MRGAVFGWLLVASVVAISGYSLLLSVVPLWVAAGGSGALGAGASTGVFMATTVGAQLLVPWLLRRFRHRVLFALGLVLLGAPTPLLALSGQLVPVLALSALRGVGFGVFTVVSNALVAELAPASEHGRAAARYGMAVGLPQLVLLPAGIGLVDRIGFEAVFLLGAAPLLGLIALLYVRLEPGAAAARASPAAPVAPTLPPVAPDALSPDALSPDALSPDAPPDARSPDAWPPVAPPVAPPLALAGGRSLAGPSVRGRSSGWLLVGPVVAMVTCAIAQGGLVTFLPLTEAGSLVVFVALLGTTTGALVGRLVAGVLGDRGSRRGRLLGPGMVLGALGMVADLLALLDPAGSANPGGSANPANPANPAGPANPVGVVALVLGAALVGIGFGLVQNDSLVSMFALSGPARYSTASAVWNAAYDTGTGIGAVGLGALAQGFGFRVAFGAVALLLLAGLPALASGAVRKVN